MWRRHWPGIVLQVWDTAQCHSAPGVVITMYSCMAVVGGVCVCVLQPPSPPQCNELKIGETHLTYYSGGVFIVDKRIPGAVNPAYNVAVTIAGPRRRFLHSHCREISFNRPHARAEGDLPVVLTTVNMFQSLTRLIHTLYCSSGTCYSTLRPQPI